jgi:hypothetical protein
MIAMRQIRRAVMRAICLETVGGVKRVGSEARARREPKSKRNI